MSNEDVIRIEEQIKTLFNNDARIEQNRKEDRAWTEKCLGEINDKLAGLPLGKY